MIVFLSLLFSFSIEAQNLEQFTTIYKSLSVQPYDLSHENNIKMLKSFSSEEGVKSKINSLKAVTQKCSKPVVCQILKHEIKRLRKRRMLGKKLKKKNIETASDLKKDPHLYRRMYRHALFEWTSDFKFSAIKMSSFAKKDIRRIRKEMVKLPVDSRKTTKSKKKVIAYLKDLNQKVKANLSKTFTRKSFPKINFKHNTNKNAQHVPGYYDQESSVFYFTIPKEGVYLSDLEWLFLHEAIPGHHMQVKLGKESITSKIFDREFVYLDFIEGWAAYVETYGKDLGIYKDPRAHRKALEWALLRSTRVIVDIGIHLKGWTDAKAKKEWKDLAPETYHFADREIARMRKWPAQVISYVYGKKQIMDARGKYLEKSKNLLSFHEDLLLRGQIPTSLL